MTISSNPSLKLGIRPATRAKFDLIASHNRWTLAETADALADDYLQRHDLTLPDQPQVPPPPPTSGPGCESTRTPAADPTASERMLDTSDADPIPPDASPVFEQPRKQQRRKGAA